MAPPLLVNFIQVHIIAPLSFKINPYLKIFFRRDRLRAHQTLSSVSSPDFLHKKLPVVIITTLGKVDDLSRRGSPVMSILPALPHPWGGCGKLLWINLWRMWKTPGYQQVFLFLPGAGAVENAPVLVCITSFFPEPRSALRHRGNWKPFPENRRKMFHFCENRPSKPFCVRGSEQIFC